MASSAVPVIAFVWYVAFSRLNQGALAAPPTDIKPNVIYYNTRNTTQGSPFSQNLQSVFQYLLINAQTPETNFSYGAYPDIVYGFSGCYSSRCDLCLDATLSDFQTTCPLAVGAQKYSNGTGSSCYVRYENYKFLAGDYFTYNKTPANVTTCRQQNSTEGTSFAHNLDILLTSLISRTAITGPSIEKQNNFSGSANCYSTAEADCAQCLGSIREEFKAECPLAVGAQKLFNVSSSYTCFLQYDETKQELPSGGPSGGPSAGTAASQNQTEDSSNPNIIISTAVASTIVLMLMLTGCMGYIILKRKHKLKLRGQTFYNPGDPEGNFSFDELRNATEDFQESNKIGQGGFASVYRGVLRNGREVAVKRLHVEGDRGLEGFLNEVKVASSLQHRNLVRMEGYCAMGCERLLVLEYISNGTLDQALHGRTLYLDWPARQDIILGIARGLAYLHEETHELIIHRDIKTSNILLDDKLNPKISDFGISKPLDRDRDSSLNSTTRIIGTIGYIAPEYALRGELTDKADVFSFGMLILEIVSGRRCKDQALPTGQRFLLKWSLQLHLGKQLENIIDPALDLTGDSKAEALRVLHIALLCTQHDPESRPKMSTVLTMFTDHNRELPLPVHSEAAMGAETLIACFASSSSEQSASQDAITVLAPC